MDRLTVDYSLRTMISDGLIFNSMTLENPTILLQRDNAGWNFSRFVKTRRNTGGRGAPTITMESIAIKNGHLIVNDRGRLVGRSHASQHAIPLCLREAGDRDFDSAVCRGRR